MVDLHEHDSVVDLNRRIERRISESCGLDLEQLSSDSGDTFGDLVNGKIDIIAYLDSSGNPNFGENLPNIFDDIVGTKKGKMLNPQDVLSHNMYGNANQQKMAQGSSTAHPNPYHLRLPDSPPDTDSGAGSTGSPSGSIPVDQTSGGDPSGCSPGQYGPSHTQHHRAGINGVAHSSGQSSSSVVGSRSGVIQASSMSGGGAMGLSPSASLHSLHQMTHQNGGIPPGHSSQQQLQQQQQHPSQATNGHLHHSQQQQQGARGGMMVAQNGQQHQGGLSLLHQQPQGLILSVPELNQPGEYPLPSPAQGQHPQQVPHQGMNGASMGLSPQDGFPISRSSSGLLPQTQQVSPAYPQAVFDSLHNHPGIARKRLRSEDGYAVPSVKPEPLSPNLTDDGFYDEGFSHQAIRFFEFQKETWHSLCDNHGRELTPLGFHIVADKGFNYSPNDQAFINQKKNHFQITVQIGVHDRVAPKFVRVAGESGNLLKPIDEFRIVFYGVKAEMPTSAVQIKQSQSDRKPIPYQGSNVKLVPNNITKVSVPRLHFSETTLNNQRKNGRPNPDQKYFQLVVALKASDPIGESYTIACYASERVIVRASNPGQFENSENDVLWQRGTTPGSICYSGPIGIGTTQPQAALHVQGDLHVVGKVTNPSDRRLKTNIEEVDTSEALNKMSQIRIVHYEFRPEACERFGIDPVDGNQHVGVIAQEVEALLPEAVRNDGDYMQVNESRIFYESAAAVKELCRLTGNLEFKIDEVEKIANKCNRLREKLKRVDSFLSLSSIHSGVSKTSQVRNGNVNGYAFGSQLSVTSTEHGKDKALSNGLAGGSYLDKFKSKKLEKERIKHSCYCQRVNGIHGTHFCRNKILQWTIVGLVAVMALCLIAMATLYILEWYHRHKNLPSHYGKYPTDSNSTDGHSSLNIGHLIINNPDPGGSDGGVGPDGSPWQGRPPPLHPCLSLNCLSYCCPPPDIVLLDKNGNKEHSGLLSRMKYDQLIEVESLRVPQSSDLSVKVKIAGDEVKSSGKEKSNRPKRSVGGPASSISIRNLNQTVLDHGTYCSGKACSDDGGRFTYFVPVTRYMPHMPLEIEFEADQDKYVELCDHDLGQHCSGLEDARDEDDLFVPQTQARSSVYSREVNVWELPVGSHLSSSYTFRVAYSSPCMLKPDEAGRSFEEFKLVFQRVCN